MAISISNVFGITTGSWSVGFPATITSPSFSTTAGNTYLLSLVRSSYLTPFPDSITGNGCTWTLVQSNDFTEIWQGVCTSSTTGTITFSYSGSSVGSLIYSIDSISGLGTILQIDTNLATTQPSVSTVLGITLASLQPNSVSYMYAGEINTTGFSRYASSVTGKGGYTTTAVSGSAPYYITEYGSDNTPNVTYGSTSSPSFNSTIYGIALELAVPFAAASITTTNPTVSANVTNPYLPVDVSLTTTNPTISASATGLAVAVVSLTTTNPTIFVNAMKPGGFEANAFEPTAFSMYMDASSSITTTNPTIAGNVSVPIVADISLTTINPTISATIITNNANIALTTINPTIAASATSQANTNISLTTVNPTISASATGLSTAAVSITTVNPTISSTATSLSTAAISLTTLQPTISAFASQYKLIGFTLSEISTITDSINRSRNVVETINNTSTFTLSNPNRTRVIIETEPTFVSRSSVGTYTDTNGYLQTALTNVARWTKTASTVSLLVEGVGTNTLLNAQSFTSTNWGIGNVTPSNAIGPDGLLSASTATSAATLYGCLLRQNPTNNIAINTQYTFSMYAKAGTWTTFGLRLSGGSADPSDHYCHYDLSTGVATAVTARSGSNDSVSMRQLANGWWRCVLVYTSGSSIASQIVDFALCQSDGATGFTPAGTETLYVYGGQIELGNTATSYIPTTTVNGNRSTDVTSTNKTTSTLSYTLNRSRNIIENVNNTSNLTYTINRGRKIIETINNTSTITESINRLRTDTLSLTNTSAISEHINRNRNIVENISNTSTLSLTSTQRHRNVVENVNNTSNLSFLVGINKSVAYNISTTTLTNFVINRNRNVSETILTNSNISFSGGLYRNVVLNINETSTITMFGGRIHYIGFNINATSTLSFTFESIFIANISVMNFVTTFDPVFRLSVNRQHNPTVKLNQPAITNNVINDHYGSSVSTSNGSPIYINK